MKHILSTLYLITAIIFTGCSVQSSQSTGVPLAGTTTRPSQTLQDIPSATTIPTGTPSPIPTMQFIPTLTPALIAADPSAYHLAALTADQADEILARLEQMILVIEDVPGYQWNEEDSYLSLYRAAWYAAWDAIAQFPDDPRAESWHWKMAHYMALSGDVDEANRTYTDLISATLNLENVFINDLPSHVSLGNTQFGLYSPSFIVNTTTISVPNTDHGFIVTIGNLNHPDSAIDACFLVTEKNDRYTTYYIQHSFLDFGYNLMRRDTLSCLPEDVTDDGVDEIITNHYRGGHNGSYTYQVFDITTQPPKPMTFSTKKDGKSVEYYGLIHGYPNVKGRTQIQFINPIGGQCKDYQIENFQWSGKSFELISHEYHFTLPPDTDEFSTCLDWLLGSLSNLDTRDAAAYLEQVITAYHPYAETLGDAYIELVLRQAVYYAIDGQTEKARSTVAQVVQNPILSKSIWHEPAERFLQIYQKPADLYRASAELISCTPYRNLVNDQNTCFPIQLYDTETILNHLLKNIYPSIPMGKIIESLEASGLKMATEGWFDFDQDGTKELWFTTLRPQNDTYQLWIVVESPKGKTVFNLDFYIPNVPEPTIRVKHSISHSFYISLAAYRNFELLRDPKNDEPYINWLEDHDLDEHGKIIRADLAKFKELRQSLLRGDETKSIYDQMVAIDLKYKDCPFAIEYYEDPAASYDCAAFYYTLAYAAELTGKEEEAVKRYYAIWSVFPKSPFTLLARIKLRR